MTDRPRVLLVDDDDDARSSLAWILDYHRFDVTPAATGREALARARPAPDLVVLDLGLPDLDGYEVCRRLKADPDTARAAVLMLSGRAVGSGDRAHGLDEGADAFLLKPAEPDVLVAQLRALLRVRRAEEEKEQFVALVEHSADFVGMAALDGRVTYVNPAGRAMVGLGGDRPVGDTRVEDYVPAEVATLYREVAIPRALAGGRWQGEVRFRHFGTGRLLDVEQALFAVRAAGTGGPVCLATVARDVTERKQLQAQFLQAQKMEAVGRLAGGVAHDFNNLLTVINGYADLALDAAPPDSPLPPLLTEVRRAGDRAAGLTGQLLAFSRQSVVAPRVLDPNAQVAGVERMLRRLIGEDIDLAVRLDPVAGCVRIDPGQLEQVLMNLAVNARDAMPAGGKLTVETRNVRLDETYTRAHPGVESGRYVLVAVSDTGVGMTEEVKARMFEPFFTTKGPGQGTGLGLSTVFGIVRQAGGSVEVYSEPGLGTTVKVYLPRCDAAAGVAPGPSAVLPPARGTETVLLAEDEDAVRALSGYVLRAAGYTVLEAAGGDEAVRAAAGHAGPVHLLVTDVVMPGMSGRELAGRLAAARPGVRVLYLSGYTDDAVVRHGILDGEVNFLQKPYTPAALARAVRDALDAG